MSFAKSYKNQRSLSIANGFWRSRDLKAMFAVIYCVFFVVLQMALLPLWIFSARQGQRQHQETVIARVNQTIQSVEGELSYITGALSAINDSIETTVKTGTRDPSGVLELQHQQRYLHRLLLKSQVIWDIYLLYANNSFVTSKYTFLDAELFNDYYVRYDNLPVGTHGRYRQALFERDYGAVAASNASFLNGQQREILEFYAPMIGSGTEGRVQSIYLLDASFFKAQIDKIGAVDAWNLTKDTGPIVAFDGVNLVHGAFPESDKNSLTHEIYSPTLGLTFAFAIHELTLFEALGLSPFFVLGYGLFLILFALALAVASSWYQTKPIQELYAMVRTDDGRGGVCVSEFRHTLQLMNRQMIHYEEEVHTLGSILEQRTFQLLLHDIEPPDLIEGEPSIFASAYETPFRLILFQWHQMPHERVDQAIRSKLNTFFSERYQQSVYVHKLPGKGYLIVLMGGLELKTLHHDLQLLHQHILQVYGCHLQVVICDQVCLRNQIHEVYTKLQNTIMTVDDNEPVAILYGEEKDTYRPIEPAVLRNIRQMILDQDEAIYETIEKVWKNASPSTSLERSQLFFTIKNSIDILRTTMIAEPSQSLDISLQSVPQLDFSCVKELQSYAQQTMRDLQPDKEDTQNPTMIRICAYINEHYTDHQLYGKYIAEKFKISEKYFYSSFKKTIGQSFSSYLKNLRIRHSCNLLHTTNLTIHEVAVKSGFQTADTFSKAFRRHMGCSPGQFRKDHIMAHHEL